MVISLFYHKQGFHVARAESPSRERDLASDLGIAKMHHRQEFGVHPSLSDWFRPRYEPNVCLLLKHRETQSRGYFFLERLVAQVRLQILFSRTLEKLGRTLEP